MRYEFFLKTIAQVAIYVKDKFYGQRANSIYLIKYLYNKLDEITTCSICI